MTASGKTTLAKKLVQRFKQNGIYSLVLDPLHDPEWDAYYQTADNEDFLKHMYEYRTCALFVDESGAAIGRYAKEMSVVATQSRHFGHRAHFITQRAAQLDRTVRDQCTELWLFRVGHNDAKILAEEFGYQELRNADQLQKGECFKVSRFAPPVKISVFDSPGQNPIK